MITDAAFPIPHQYESVGLTKREYFTLHIVAALLTTSRPTDDGKIILRAVAAVALLEAALAP